MWNFFRKRESETFDEELLNQLYRYAYSLCQDESLAFDLVQSSCEKALRLNNLRKRKKAYLMTTIRNAFIDQYRRRHLELVVEANELDSVIQNDSLTMRSLEELQIEKENVKLVLEELSPQERELLFLWAVEGKTLQEIASLTDTPIGTLLSRIRRMRKRLVAQFGHLNEQVL
ncbi:RNA polymerase sigma factor [Grimontia sp. S25]|uniref:RNA polymerase sigma factor n=2 Tax=Grimontia sedimenti TaxID=2711294 RepID=A0A6M1R258_9GAMM|nr:RNA polymerase sigma factor [Grimontia sedimenti]NGN96285.1 RNA polymerase sigma factor [Grimontia sedimenti]